MSLYNLICHFVTILYTYIYRFFRRSAYKMEQKSTAVESNKSTLVDEQELLRQLEDTNQAQESTESPTTLLRTTRSIINPPPRLNKDGSLRYRRDAKGVLRRVYN